MSSNSSTTPLSPHNNTMYQTGETPEHQNSLPIPILILTPQSIAGYQSAQSIPDELNQGRLIKNAEQTRSGKSPVPTTAKIQMQTVTDSFNEGEDDDRPALITHRVSKLPKVARLKTQPQPQVLIYHPSWPDGLEKQPSNPYLRESVWNAWKERILNLVRMDLAAATVANIAEAAEAAERNLAFAAGNPGKRKRFTTADTKRSRPRHAATASLLSASYSTAPIFRDFGYPVIERLHHMPPICRDNVLTEVSNDVDAQEKTDEVLVDVFWRRYEMAEVGRAISGVAASGSTEGQSDLEFEAGVLAGDGVVRKGKRKDEPGEYPVNTRVRRETDLPGFAPRGSLVKNLKRKRPGPVRFPGFQRPDELTWEHVVAAGGVPGHVGGAVVEAGKVGVGIEFGHWEPGGLWAGGGGLSRRKFRVSKGRGGGAGNMVNKGRTGAGVGGAKHPSPMSGSGSGGGGGRGELRSGRGWPSGSGFPKGEIGDAHADSLVDYMFRRTGTRFLVPEPSPTAWPASAPICNGEGGSAARGWGWKATLQEIWQWCTGMDVTM